MGVLVKTCALVSLIGFFLLIILFDEKKKRPATKPLIRDDDRKISESTNITRIYDRPSTLPVYDRPSTPPVYNGRSASPVYDRIQKSDMLRVEKPDYKESKQREQKEPKHLQKVESVSSEPENIQFIEDEYVILPERLDKFLQIIKGEISKRYNIKGKQPMIILERVISDFLKEQLCKDFNIRLADIAHLKPKHMNDFMRNYDHTRSDYILTRVSPLLYFELVSLCSKETPFNGAGGVEPLDLLSIARFVVNKSTDPKIIKSIYKDIIDVAKNHPQDNVKANAVDMLLLSNNTMYMSLVPDLMERVRRSEEKKEDAKRLEAKRAEIIDMKRGADIRQNLGNRRHRRGAPPRTPWGGTVIPMQTHRDRAGLHPLDTINERDDIDLAILLAAAMENEIKNPKTKKKTIYEDTQNVHTKEINDSVLSIAKKLVEQYPITRTLMVDLTNVKKEKKDKIEKSIHRLKTDPSTFKYGLTLNAIFVSMLEFIDNHKEKVELNARLLQELEDMSGQCTTGHLSRLINTIQGFDSMKLGDSARIQVGITDEIYAKLSKFLEKKMEEEPNDMSMDLMDGMDKSNKNRKMFLNFIVNKTNEYLIPALEKDYNKNVTGETLTALIQFSNSAKDFPEIVIDSAGIIKTR